MKILIITQYFWPENFRVNDLAKELNKIYSVSILTGEPNYPSGKIFDEYRLNKKKLTFHISAKTKPYLKIIQHVNQGPIWVS